MKYKRLTRAELRDIQARAKLWAPYIRDEVMRLLAHAMAMIEVEEAFQAKYDELQATDFFKRIPRELAPTKASEIGSPFVDDKKLFQAYEKTLVPGSIEEQRVRRWSGRSNNLDSVQLNTHTATHDEVPNEALPSQTEKK